jgi:hypothetical protein
VEQIERRGGPSPFDFSAENTKRRSKKYKRQRNEFQVLVRPNIFDTYVRRNDLPAQRVVNRAGGHSVLQIERPRRALHRITEAQPKEICHGLVRAGEDILRQADSALLEEDNLISHIDGELLCELVS